MSETRDPIPPGTPTNSPPNPPNVEKVSPAWPERQSGGARNGQGRLTAQ